MTFCLSHSMTKQQNDLCTQQSLGSAWASSQSDQFAVHFMGYRVDKDSNLLRPDSEDWSEQVILFVLLCSGLFW